MFMEVFKWLQYYNTSKLFMLSVSKMGHVKIMLWIHLCLQDPCSSINLYGNSQFPATDGKFMTWPMFIPAIPHKHFYKNIILHDILHIIAYYRVGYNCWNRLKSPNLFLAAWYHSIHLQNWWLHLICLLWDHRSPYNFSLFFNHFQFIWGQFLKLFFLSLSDDKYVFSLWPYICAYISVSLYSPEHFVNVGHGKGSSVWAKGTTSGISIH